MKHVRFLIILLFLICLGIYPVRSKFWDSKGKLVLVTNGRDQNITVSVIDPRVPTRTDIEIPKNVLVSVAGELGNWKLGSVWQLGVNEKKEGDLLVRTLVKNFGFPVVAWRDETSGETNLNWGDRIRLWLFRFKIDKNSQNIIDLTKTSFLKKTKLVDGEDGWRISGEAPSSVTAVFPQAEVLRAGYRAKIINYSGNVTLGENAGRVVETLGIKIASIQKEEPEDFGCAVWGVDEKLIEKLKLLFGCEDKPTETGEGDYEVKLELGRDFARRF